MVKKREVKVFTKIYRNDTTSGRETVTSKIRFCYKRVYQVKQISMKFSSFSLSGMSFYIPHKYRNNETLK